MGMYTSKPEVDNGLCNSPYDKFYKIQCEMNERKAWTKKRSLILNRNEVINKESYLSDCRKTLKCAKKSCIYGTSDIINTLQMICDKWESTFAEIEKVFEERPYLLEFECLQNADYSSFFYKIELCVFRDLGENCVISSIAENCKDEIVEHFKKPIEQVSNTCIPSVEEGSGAE
uniref:DUF19 domain-containing protein n=3 Tax=Caenorhabditis tropicalis TaxID=1561998 RepID=A0A1I7UW52_9PELO